MLALSFFPWTQRHCRQKYLLRSSILFQECLLFTFSDVAAAVGVELAELRPDLLLVLREVAVAPDKLILVKAGQA